jgi:hypothetical membrane protein
MSEIATRPGVAAAGATPATTRVLLAAGFVSGPFFALVVVVQMLTRPGFDIRRHQISLLSLGDLGWIQMATFVLAGLGGIACAAGVRRLLAPGRGGTWGPALLALWGVGLVAAGVFTPDPSLGFPPGTSPGIPVHMSWHSSLHGVAFSTTFIALVAASLVFARRFAGLRRPGWAAYCIATGVAAPAMAALGMSNPGASAVPFALAGAVAFAWVSVLALQLMRESATEPQPVR